MGPDAGRAARVATIVLMGVAYTTCEAAAHPDGRPRTFGVGFGAALFSAAAVAGFVVPVPAPGRRMPARLTALLAALVVLPVAAEPLLREWTGDGAPLELQLVNGLRALGVALAGAAAWQGCRRLAGVVAVFLALFASAMGDQPAIPYLLAAFALAGGAWLVLDHRARANAAADGVAEGVAERVALRLPVREAAVFGLLAAAAVAVAVAGPKRVTLALGELVPTSGGTGDTDPFARSGVGDGPEETAGPDARAAGMVETDKMIEDNRNALVDAVNDMFGPPHKPNKEQERMVAAGRMDVIQTPEPPPDNRRPSRPFDTARAGPKTDREPGSAAARGAIEVEGRTPLHVRLVAYPRYDPDGGAWREGLRPNGRLIEPDGGDWMRVAAFPEVDGRYAADDRHRLKVADLRANLVPTPPLTTRFRINKVDRPDYYEWDADGILALAGRKRTPPGVVVTADSRTVDPTRLGAGAFGPPGGPACEVPDGLRADLARVAAAWAGDRPRGWPQVSAVLDRLRADYVLDRAAAAPPGHPAPVLWFLLDSRRGPDYLFATAAALLLRSLDYPARVCLGYYAAPAAYDPDTGHTPVGRGDLHVWPELRLADHHWLVVEPTPGYEILPPLKPWPDQLAAAAATAAAWAARNAPWLAAAAAVAGFLAWRRKAVADAARTGWWRVRPGRTWRQSTLRAVRVLEHRGRLAGRPRPADHTLAEWAAGLAAARDPGPGLGDLVRLTEWAAYAPDPTPPLPDPMAVCRRALGEWPLRRFAAAGEILVKGGPA